ncbi:MAG: cupin domain-containing protein [Haloarculaceae archaeon]
METVSLSVPETVEVEDGVHLTQLVAGDRMSVQHFHVEAGATIPEHSHEHEQVGYVYAGAMTFTVGGEAFVVGPNESYVLPSNEPHAAENPGDDPVQGIDVFAPPRPNPDWAQ